MDQQIGFECLGGSQDFSGIYAVILKPTVSTGAPQGSIGPHIRRKEERVVVPPRPREHTYVTSFMCVAMYHLFPNASFTPALRSP